MTQDSVSPGPANGSDEALARALAAAHDALAAKLALLEASLGAGQLTAVQASDQARAARAVYDRDRSLAELAAETGWECWVGVHGILYARLALSSPPWVVRAPSAQALREAIQAKERGGRRLAP